MINPLKSLDHAITLLSPRQRTTIGLFLSGVLFFGVFWWSYGQLDEDLYVNRDDGIITVSHARNFVEFGSIGVNPSGERVEGYSSPLQFVIFSVVYAVFHNHYDGYFLIVAGVSAFFMGTMIFLLCMPYRRWGLTLSGLATIALSRDYSFFEWHASGMENALTHAFFLLAVVVLVRMGTQQRIHYGYVLPVVAAAFARIESIYHIGPLLAIFAVFWLVAYRDLGGLKFVTLSLLLWAACFVLRWHYFGNLFPNTAAAQGISIGDRIVMTLSGDGDYWRSAWRLSSKLFFWHHGLILIPITLGLPFLRWNKKTVLALMLLSSLASTGLASPFLFGGARLDVTRLSTQVALAIVALAALVTVQTRRSAYRYVTVPLMVVFVSGLLYWSNTRWEHKPYYLWFSENVFAEFRDNLIDLREEHDIPRPTLANPDLGLMSWHKEFNIVDLGYLGNPALTELDRLGPDHKRDIANYFFDIAAPDLIEIHGVWSERHAHLFKDPRFHENYLPASATIDNHLRKQFGRNANFRAEYGDYVRAGYWVRRDSMASSDSRERQLIDDLRDVPSLERVESELQHCVEAGYTTDQTFYVVRTAYRFLPEFVAQGDYAGLIELLESFQGKLGYSTALLSGRRNPHWEDDLVDYVLDYGPQRIGDRMDRDKLAIFAPQPMVLPAHAITDTLRLLDFRLTPTEGGWGKLQLLLQCDAPLDRNWKVYIHGHIDEASREHLPPEKRSAAFLNWDIDLPDPPTTQWDHYGTVVLTHHVPHVAAVESIRLGLYAPGAGSLGTPVVLPLTDGPSPSED